ncbi:MAG: hypothetical protein K8S20_01180 [Chloroflexi bacterium]|nr:hypothetical protein [Chloroflexota bacterium]
MKSPVNPVFICLALLLASCQTTPTIQPTEPPGPSSTPKSAITSSATPDPRAKYEGECVFCFVGGSNKFEPVWDAAAKGFTYHSDDPREIITLDENFRVNKGENITFENKIVLIKPTRRKDIEIFGTLTIRNSYLIWQQTEYQQSRLRVKRGGSLVITDSFSFQGNQYWVNWEFEDGSTIQYDHFIGDPWTSIRGSVNYTAANLSTVKVTFFNDVHDSTVKILNAHHVWFELYPGEGIRSITFPAKRQWANWSINDLWPNTTIEVTDSYIYERDISIGNNTHITVQDVPSGFSLGWSVNKDSSGYVNCELKNLGEPGNDQGVFYEDTTWDLPCNNSSLTVKNSLLQTAWPVTSGYVHLKVYNSNLADTRNYGGNATMEIYNSSIGIVAAYNGGLVYVENSTIKDAIEIKDPHSFIYGYGVTGGFETLESDGGIYTELDQAGPPWK